MPTSSSDGSCCTHYRTAFTASATTAISPTAPATISPAVVGCSMPLTLVPASVPTHSPKKIPRLPHPPSPSVPIAAAPYGGSQPCHAPATLRHSPVTHHDRAADVDRDRARPPHIGQQCPQRHRTADQSSSSRKPFLRALQIDTIATHSFRAMATLGNKLPSTRCRRPSIARDCYRSGHYPHSAQPPAASFNPASMRSRSTSRPSLDLATRPHRTLKIAH